MSGIKVGAIGSFGKDDGGWTQAQYTGLTMAMKDLGLSEDQFVFIDNVAETGNDFTNAAEGLLADGCNVIVGASTGYKSAIETLAKEYPDVQFAQVFLPAETWWATRFAPMTACSSVATCRR